MQQVHMVSLDVQVAQGMLTALHAVPAALSVSTGLDGLPPGCQLLIHYSYPYDPLVSLTIGELSQLPWAMIFVDERFRPEPERSRWAARSPTQRPVLDYLRYPYDEPSFVLRVTTILRRLRQQEDQG